jgi:uncharacterized membrane protein
MMTPDELIDQWRRGLRVSHRAHFEAAKLYRRRHLWLAIPTVTISALLGTTVFANLQHSDDPTIKFALAVFSIAMIVLSSLQSFLRFSETSERHQTAAVQIGEVRRELEQQLVFAHRDEPVIKALREKWDAADRQAPTIPSRIYDSVQSTVLSEETKARV